MGIPSYFSYIIKNYPKIIKCLQHFTGDSFDGFHHLYMDCNSIIYDSVRTIESLHNYCDFTNAEFENMIIDSVIENIRAYIFLIKPVYTVMLAFDGVAPFAKMEQQRTRRYKTHKSGQFKHIIQGEDVNSAKWNTSAITPGTAFMKLLATRIKYSFENSEGEYRIDQMIVTTSDEAGEGEHKIVEHIRSKGEAVKNDNIAIYGLDADLIMLSIFHINLCKNIYVFREAPEFLKSSIPVLGNENDPHFVDISCLISYVLSEMSCAHYDPHRIYDYAFLCFFLGNDFLPHFPAMNIRTHGIQGLLDIYRNVVGKHMDRFFVSKTTGKIQWKNVGLFVNDIAKKEHQLLMNEYFTRDKFEKRTWKESTEKEKDDVLQSVPIIFRSIEKYISPSDKYWENRYYKTLFHGYSAKDNIGDSITNVSGKTDGSVNIKSICVNYLEGLEWVYKYYTSGCSNWHWKYNYHYPPLFVDLCKHIPHFETEFIKETTKSLPFLPETQLSYVLPRHNLGLLPTNVDAFLKTHYLTLYPEEYDFQWAFCKYFWESHPILPEIPLELLKQWDIQFGLASKTALAQ